MYSEIYNKKISENDSSLKLFLFKGKCMQPLLQPGDILLIKNDSEFKLRDTLIYEINNRKNAHRLLGMRKINNRMLFILQGDRSKGSVDLVLPSEIAGKVVGFVRNKKMQRLDNGLYFLANLFLGQFYIFRYQIAKLWQEIKEICIKPFLALILGNKTIQRLFALFLNKNFKFQVDDSNPIIKLTIEKGHKDIARVFMEQIITKEDNFFKLNGFWVWWPFRTQELGTQLLNRTQELAREKYISHLNLPLKNNSFPMIKEIELQKQGFYLSKNEGFKVWNKDL